VIGGVAFLIFRSADNAVDEAIDDAFEDFRGAADDEDTTTTDEAAAAADDEEDPAGTTAATTPATPAPPVAPPTTVTPPGPTDGGAVGPDSATSGTVAAQEIRRYSFTGDGQQHQFRVEGVDAFDPTIRITDAVTGAQIGFSNDFADRDSLVTLTIEPGRVVLLDVEGLDGQPGSFTLRINRI
jgi:hypothetical protein